MKILCLPYNYQRQETAQITLPDVQYAGKPLYPPQGQPIIVKPDTAYLNNNKPFFIPHHTTLVAAKAQMALRIGKMGRNIDERFALRYINGIGTAVDIVAQNLLLQCEQQRAPWSMATGFDGSAPVSGFIGDITEADNSEVVMRINDAACKIACPQVEMGNLHLMRSGLAINCIRLINDSASPFCV